MQVSPTVYRCTQSDETTETLKQLFPESIPWDCARKEDGSKVIIYEVRKDDTAEKLASMMSSENFFLFIANREFDHHFLSLSKDFFFEFTHIDDPVEDLIIHYNTLVKYFAMTVELQKKTEELENTVFELAFASTNVLEQNEFLEQMAKKDGLTLLYNHSYFKDRLKSEFDKSKRYGNRFTVALLDLDFFKKVNDSYGHPKGDEVLRAFAVIIGENIRETDIAARYGGEEFAIVFPETDTAHAVIALERIKQGLKEIVFESETGCFKITFSAGVTEFDQKFSHSEEMIQNADKALYISKRDGRDRTTVL
ncbi:GGDEF domain-containing protein [Geovibrio ferrireducens]|uniref:GGDEF domain-containing protein n=1 Tax=Geovibrio ferrireducens TaxID=46201 RepID=UPI002246FE15|nr:GGDEF domain-containing protein [Geovibrio ferrireducens]